MEDKNVEGLEGLEDGSLVESLEEDLGTELRAAYRGREVEEDHQHIFHPGNKKVHIITS